MSLQIRTFIQGEHKNIDLYKDEPVLLSLSFAEVQDITRKNSAFSKAFSVPGSQRNNEIFNFFYDLNSVPLTFNPNNKFNAQILWDGYQILEGYIRLNGVSIQNDEIIYQVTFYNQVGDLAANIGDKFLFDLDLSSLSHPYSENVVLQSILDPTLFALTGNTNYSYQNGKTFWGLYNIGYQYISGTTLDEAVSPLLQFSPLLSANTQVTYFPITGNFDNEFTPVRDYYFKPTLQIKTLYEKICEEAGYEIQSNFFETDYFKKFYMPLKFLDETIYSKNAILACFNYGGQSFTLTNPMSAVYTQPNSGLTCNSLGFPVTSNSFTISSGYSGTYEFRFTFTLIGQGDLILGQIPNVALWVYDGVTAQQFYSNTFYDVYPQPVSIQQSFIFTGTSTVQFYFIGEYTAISGFTAEIINPTRYLPNGLNIDYGLEFPENDYSQIDFITSINKYFNLVVVPNPDKPNTLIVEPIIDYIGKGRVLDWTTKIDASQIQSLYPTSSLINGTLEYEFKLDQDYANQDFKTQANRIFGTDKFKLNLEYRDQVTKFNYMFSSPIDITINNAFIPILTLSSMSKVKTIDRNGQSLQTFVPFKILPKLIFRGALLPTDNWGFVGDAQTITGDPNCTSGVTINVTTAGYLKYQDCFGTQVYDFVSVGTKTYTDCINPNTFQAGFPYAQLAVFSITSTGTTCGSAFNPGTYQTWWMNSFQQDRFVNLNRFTTYPFNYNGFSHYCNFRGEDKTNITPPEYTYTAPDLYDIYYKPYVDDLINEENKIYSAKIYLYPQEIQQLRWDERILINNTYFRINKITNYNLTEPAMCDIELVKLTKEYEGHKVLYYDLLPCSGSTELHSNSDLMYHLYEYAGNFVKLYDDNLNYLGCYNVAIGQYNSGYTYSHYYISSGYTESLVGAYPDCACTGRTALDIVREEPDTPRIFVYSGTECNSLTTYTFYSTDPNLDNTGLTYKIYNTLTQQLKCISGVTSTFYQTTLWKEIGDFTNCTDCNCVECYSYSITANTTGLISYLNCTGSIVSTNVLLGEVIQIACPGAIRNTILGDCEIQEISLCSNSCITPTPTQTSLTPTPTPTSVTPTPTPTIPVTPTTTPTPTGTPPDYQCFNYVNQTMEAWIGEYTDCNGVFYQGVYLGPSQFVCARTNPPPFTYQGVDLVQNVSCTS